MAKKTRGRKAINLKNRRFGLYKVLERVPNDGPTKWLCRCKCGVEKAVNGQSLRNGTSSGCSKCRAGRPVEPLKVRFQGKVLKRTQKQLVEEMGVTQPRISQLKKEYGDEPIPLEPV